MPTWFTLHPKYEARVTHLFYLFFIVSKSRTQHTTIPTLTGVDEVFIRVEGPLPSEAKK